MRDWIVRSSVRHFIVRLNSLHDEGHSGREYLHLWWQSIRAESFFAGQRIQVGDTPRQSVTIWISLKAATISCMEIQWYLVNINVSTGVEIMLKPSKVCTAKYNKVLSFITLNIFLIGLWNLLSGYPMYNTVPDFHTEKKIKEFIFKKGNHLSSSELTKLYLKNNAHSTPSTPKKQNSLFFKIIIWK